MILTTKFPYIREYNCKVIDFTHCEPEHESEVQIVMWDGTIEYEEIVNIAYIKA
jgi:hypothetical protein